MLGDLDRFDDVVIRIQARVDDRTDYTLGCIESKPCMAGGAARQVNTSQKRSNNDQKYCPSQLIFLSLPTPYSGVFSLFETTSNWRLKGVKIRSLSGEL